MSVHTVISIDIGGTKLAWALCDYSGKIYALDKLLWKNHDKDYVLSEIIRAVEIMFEKASNFNMIVDAVGMTIPGFADSQSGTWIEATYMGIYNIPIVSLISQRFRVPVFIENDTNACCLAEKLFGSGKDCCDFLYLTVSTGVGGACFLNNELYYGAHGLAGEFGLCNVEKDGRPLEGSRLRGCLEMYSSGRGIVKNYQEQIGDAGVCTMTAADIAVLARIGDAAAKAAFDKAGICLGMIIAAAYNLFDPEKAIIGGGLSLAFDCLRDSIMDVVRTQCLLDIDMICIEPTVLGYNGGIMGAAAIAILGLADSGKKYGYRGRFIPGQTGGVSTS